MSVRVIGDSKGKVSDIIDLWTYLQYCRCTESIMNINNIITDGCQKLNDMFSCSHYRHMEQKTVITLANIPAELKKDDVLNGC